MNKNNIIPKECKYKFSDGTSCHILVNDKYKDINKNKFCLFHSHNEAKIEEFSKLIQEEIRKKRKVINDKHIIIIDSDLSPEAKKEAYEKLKAEYCFNYEGYYFPKKYTNDKLERDHGHVIISANITFKNAIFSDVIEFSKFVFIGNVNFINTVFEKDADFSNAHFYCDKITFKSIFKGQANFTNALFQDGKPNFSETEFIKEARFNEAHFLHGANFSKTTFKGFAGFDSVKFGNEKILKEIIFNNVMFHERANFSLTEFYGPVNFDNTIFLFSNITLDCCSYIGVKFGNIAKFNNVIFKGHADFQGIQFEDKAEFNDVIFTKNAIFKNTKFLKYGLEAKGSIFFGDADFSDCNFDKEANFGEVTFLGQKVNFTGLKCTDPSLRNCTFLSDIIDLGPYLSTSFNYFEGINFIGRADFTAKNCDSYRFLNCLMIGCSFLKSDIVNTVFINCSWDFSDVDDVLRKQRKILENLSNPAELLNKFHEIEKKHKEYIKKAKRKKSNTLDEVLFWKGKDIDIGEIQECCMQLKNNRDKAKDYLTANSFYHSEMEMVRKKDEKKIITDKKTKIQLILGYSLLFILIIYKILKPFNTQKYTTIGLIIFSLFLILKTSKFLFFSIYKILSGYGNKPLYAVALFLIILIIFSALIVVLDGVKNIDTLNSTNETYEDMTFFDKLYYISMWNLANPFTSQNKQFQPKGIVAHFPIFFIQFLYRPLMIALIIFAIKRKVQR